MPKEVFFRLDEEKKERILRAARTEFLLYHNSYKTASVKRIARSAGISIGSFYEYFEGKNDLLFYVTDRITDKKQAGAEYPSLTLRERLMMMLDADIRGSFYDRDDIVLLNILIHGDAELVREYYFSHGIEPMFAILLPLLRREQEEGKVRADVNVAHIAYLLATMGFNLMQYIGANKPRGTDAEWYREVSKQWLDAIFGGIYQTP